MTSVAPSAANALAQGISRHQAGQLREAEALYRQVLAQNPRHPDALHLLGVVAYQVGKHDQAIALIEDALRLKGADAEMYSNLGGAYFALGRATEAERCYGNAIRRRPNFASAHYNLANVYLKQGRFAEAVAGYQRTLQLEPNNIAALMNFGNSRRGLGELGAAISCFEQVVRLQPGCVEAHLNLGNALRAHGRPGDAIGPYRRDLQLRPESADAHVCLGLAEQDLGRMSEAINSYRQALRFKPNDAGIYNNLAAALQELKQSAEALDCYQKALQIQPNLALVHNNLGDLFLHLERPADALACYGRALQIQPDFAEAHHNRGNALRDGGRLSEAVDSYQTALRLQPNNPEFHNNYGNALKAQGDSAAAVASYRRALEIKTDHADSHRNLGMALLAQGNWEQGWREYEWRWRCRDFSLPSFAQPRWDGGDLHGKTILLQAEQGLGDTLQFARFASLVQQCGGRAVLECQAPLAPLLTTLDGVETVVARGQPLSPFDCHAPLLSLPMLLGTTVADVPNKTPYLQADPARRAHWRDWLGRHPGLKVGIYWQGSLIYKKDKIRSAPLQAFAPLAEVPGVTLVALQSGPGREQMAAPGNAVPVLDPNLVPDEKGETFQELAALICEIDLVVAVDTVVVHLAGALGAPVWVALSHVPDWRWLIEREDTPWYPTVRLFRQERHGDWNGVFARMAQSARSIAPLPLQ